MNKAIYLLCALGYLGAAIAIPFGFQPSTVPMVMTCLVVFIHLMGEALDD